MFVNHFPLFLCLFSYLLSSHLELNGVGAPLAADGGLPLLLDDVQLGRYLVAEDRARLADCGHAELRLHVRREDATQVRRPELLLHLKHRRLAASRRERGRRKSIEALYLLPSQDISFIQSFSPLTRRCPREKASSRGCRARPPIV